MNRDFKMNLEANLFASLVFSLASKYEALRVYLIANNLLLKSLILSDTVFAIIVTNTA